MRCSVIHPPPVSELLTLLRNFFSLHPLQRFVWHELEPCFHGNRLNLLRSCNRRALARTPQVSASHSSPSLVTSHTISRSAGVATVRHLLDDDHTSVPNHPVPVAGRRTTQHHFHLPRRCIHDNNLTVESDRKQVTVRRS